MSVGSSPSLCLVLYFLDIFHTCGRVIACWRSRVVPTVLILDDTVREVFGCDFSYLFLIILLSVSLQELEAF